MAWFLRLSAGVAAVLWVTALFSRFAVHSLHALPGWPEPGPIWHGYVLLGFGWLGPLGLSVAWYANIPLAICLTRMVRGQFPGLHTAGVGFGLALTAFMPFVVPEFEVYGSVGVIIRGSAVWLWFLCFPIVLSVATLGRDARSRLPREWW